MKIIFYAAGMTGSGHVVKEISIANALRRKSIDCNYIILHDSNFSSLIKIFDINQLIIDIEDETKLSKENYHSSELYNTLISLNPDILIVDLFWFMFNSFIEELNCKKIFLCRQIADSIFSMHLESGTISFKPEKYDRVLAIEPFESKIKMNRINPIIIRNRKVFIQREKCHINYVILDLEILKQENILYYLITTFHG